MSFFQYSYPKPNQNAQPDRLTYSTLADSYIDPNGVEYRVTVTDLYNNEYSIRLYTDRLPEEQEGVKKKDLKTGKNRFSAKLKIQASRKFFQTLGEAVLTVHPKNTYPLGFEASSSNTTTVFPINKPLDVLRILFTQDKIKPKQVEFTAKEIYLDSYDLQDDKINYLGLFLSMETLNNPPDGLENNYKNSLNIIEDEVWYLKVSRADITPTILRNNQPNLYTKKSDWRTYLRSRASLIQILSHSAPLYINMKKVLIRDKSLKYFATSACSTQLEGNIYEALGNYTDKTHFWVGNTIPLNTELHINFDTEKFSLIQEDMNGATEAIRSAILAKAVDEINAILGFLDLHPGINCIIDGHTDRQGEPGYDNAALSLSRAESVKQFFLAHGLEPHRILGVNGLGSAQCGAGDFPDIDSPACRKITIRFFE